MRARGESQTPDSLRHILLRRGEGYQLCARCGEPMGAEKRKSVPVCGRVFRLTEISEGAVARAVSTESLRSLSFPGDRCPKCNGKTLTRFPYSWSRIATRETVQGICVECQNPRCDPDHNPFFTCWRTDVVPEARNRIFRPYVIFTHPNACRRGVARGWAAVRRIEHLIQKPTGDAVPESWREPAIIRENGHDFPFQSLLDRRDIKENLKLVTVWWSNEGVAGPADIQEILTKVAPRELGAGQQRKVKWVEYPGEYAQVHSVEVRTVGLSRNREEDRTIDKLDRHILGQEARVARGVSRKEFVIGRIVRGRVPPEPDPASPEFQFYFAAWAQREERLIRRQPPKVILKALPLVLPTRDLKGKPVEFALFSKRKTQKIEIAKLQKDLDDFQSGHLRLTENRAEVWPSKAGVFPKPWQRGPEDLSKLDREKFKARLKLHELAWIAAERMNVLQRAKYGHRWPARCRVWCRKSLPVCHAPGKGELERWTDKAEFMAWQGFTYAGIPQARYVASQSSREDALREIHCQNVRDTVSRSREFRRPLSFYTNRLDLRSVGIPKSPPLSANVLPPLTVEHSLAA